MSWPTMRSCARWRPAPWNSRAIKKKSISALILRSRSSTAPASVIRRCVKFRLRRHRGECRARPPFLGSDPVSGGRRQGHDLRRELQLDRLHGRGPARHGLGRRRGPQLPCECPCGPGRKRQPWTRRQRRRCGFDWARGERSLGRGRRRCCRDGDGDGRIDGCGRIYRRGRKFVCGLGRGERRWIGRCRRRPQPRPSDLNEWRLDDQQFERRRLRQERVWRRRP